MTNRPEATTPSEAATREEIRDPFRIAPVGLCVVDRELRYEQANEQYAEAVGHSVEALIGRSMADVLPEVARVEALAVLGEVIETGVPALDIELHEESPDGPAKDRFWLVNAHALTREGAIVGAMVALQNITSVRRAQRLAERRQQELESIYRNAPIGLGFVDAELRYLRVNQVIADMNGVSIEEMIGKTYRDFSPETADVAEPFLRGLMERGESVQNLEVRSRPPADRDVEHVYLFSLEPVRDAGGDVLGHLAAVQDVTELRRAQDIARLRLEELEILYAHTPVAVFHVDAELRCVHMTPLFARLSRATAENSSGCHVSELLHHEIADALLPQLQHVLRHGTSSADLEVRGEYFGSSSAGEHTWVARSYPTTSSTGEVTGVIAVLQDITDLAKRSRDTEIVRDRLAEAQQVAHVGSWEWDVLQDRVWWSRELYGIFGERPSYSPSYLGFLEHVHWADRRKLREQLEATLAHDKPYRVSFVIERPDGERRTVFAVARLERTPDGHPSRLVGTCQDVTEISPFERPTDTTSRDRRAPRARR